MNNGSVMKEMSFAMMREKFEIMKFDDYCDLAGKVHVSTNPYPMHLKTIEKPSSFCLQ